MGACRASLPQFAASPKTDPEIFGDLADQALKSKPELAYNDFAACDAFDVMERVKEIAQPVLVLTAADDMLTLPKYGQYLSDQMPDSTHVNIADAGHFSPIEKPDEVNRAIREFLKNLP